MENREKQQIFDKGGKRKKKKKKIYNSFQQLISLKVYLQVSFPELKKKKRKKSKF